MPQNVRSRLGGRRDDLQTQKEKMAVWPETTGSHSSDGVSRWLSTRRRSALPAVRFLSVLTDFAGGGNLSVCEEEESLSSFCSFVSERRDEQRRCVRAQMDDG